MGRRQLRGRCATIENPAPALADTDSAIQRPAALLHGPVHLIVYCNEPFLAEFGAGQVAGHGASSCTERAGAYDIERKLAFAVSGLAD